MKEFNLHAYRQEKLVLNCLCLIIFVLNYLLALGVILTALLVSKFDQEAGLRARVDYLYKYYNNMTTAHALQAKNIEQLEKKLLLLAKLYQRKWEVVKVLNELHNAVGDGIILQKLQLKNSQLIIEGTAQSPVNIANMMILLHNIKIFSEPILVSNDRDHNEHDHFVVNVNVSHEQMV